MGRMLETLKFQGARRSPLGEVSPAPEPTPEPDESEDVPFIEVGGKQAPVEGSPEVLASAPPPRPTLSPSATPGVPRLSAPQADAEELTALTVYFRPIAASPGPARTRFAPDLVTFHRPDHPQSKQYQSLAATLLAQLPATRCRVLLFTAAHPGAGTTTVLLNLAIAVARQGKQRVCVVDASPARPAVAERLGLPQVPGLAEILGGAAALQDVLQETGQPNLLALTAGGGRASRLGGEATRTLVRQLRERFDLVFLDGPSWSAQAGLLPLTLLCEAVYLVSPEADAQDAETAVLLQTMAQQGAPVRGHLVTAL